MVMLACRPVLSPLTLGRFYRLVNPTNWKLTLDTRRNNQFVLDHFILLEFEQLSSKAESTFFSFISINQLYF